jgi:hypothetical protein
MTESIRDLMTVNPRSLESGSTVMEAARLMHDEDAGISPESVTVGEVASRELATIDPQQELDAQTREVVEGIST